MLGVSRERLDGSNTTACVLVDGVEAAVLTVVLEEGGLGDFCLEGVVLVFLERKRKVHEMNGILGHDSAVYSNSGLEKSWVNGMNFVMNHACGAGLLAPPIDQQSSKLPQNHRCPRQREKRLSPLWNTLIV